MAVRVREAAVKAFSEVGRGRFEEDGDSKGKSSIASRLDVTVKVCRLALCYRDVTWQTLVWEQDSICSGTFTTILTHTLTVNLKNSIITYFLGG